jgi:hypothetical protein
MFATRTRYWRRSSGGRIARIFVAIAAAALAGSSVASAAPVPGGLSGETFHNEFVTEGIGGVPRAQDCHQDGTSTVHFTTSGTATATGPYPGQFTETGTLTIGPQTLAQTNVVGTAQAGPVLTFTANFTVTSGTTTITGTKTLSATYLNLAWNSIGACAGFENSTKLGILDPTFFITVSGRSYMANVSSTYEATINSNTGTIHDTGDSLTSFNEVYITAATCILPTCIQTGSANPFVESFESVAQPPPVVPEAPFAITLPLAGLLIGGGWLVYRRRRPISSEL